jgi:hypothetical protein
MIYEYCNRIRIKPVFYKGALLSKVLYNDLFIRQYSDIDILLRSEDISNMDMVLKNLGFELDKKGLDLNDNPDEELVCYSYNKTLNERIISVDISTFIPGISINDLREFILYETEEVILNNNVINTFNLTFTLITFCSNLYYKIKDIGNEKCIREYIDLCLLIKICKNSVELNNSIRNIIRLYGLEYQFDFIIKNMKMIIHVSDESIYSL